MGISWYGKSSVLSQAFSMAWNIDDYDQREYGANLALNIAFRHTKL